MDRRGQGMTTSEASPVAVAQLQSSAPGIGLPLQKILTIELAAYVAIFILGFAIRIGHLDAYPLDPSEATRALSGWQVVRGETPLSWQEPLVILSAALSFLALGDSDVMARLAPVAVGSALVLLPSLLRAQIGRTSALLASLFLAVSPTFVFYSRTLSGDIFAAALSLGLLSCIVRYIGERKAQWAVMGGGLLALLLNSGAPGIAFLLAFAAFFALIAALGKGSNEYVQAWESLKGDREALKQAGIVLLGGFVLVGSGFLGNLSGLKLPALSAWVAEFDIMPDGRPWFFHLELLLGYEPLIFLFGVAGAAYYIYQWQKPQGRRALGIKGFLVFWAIVSFLAAAFTGSKHGGQLLGILLPLSLLAGSLAGEIGERAGSRLSGIGRGLLAGGASFLVYALLLVSDLTQKDRLAFWYQWMLVLLALALVATLVAAAVAREGPRVSRLVALIGLALLLGYSVHATWRTAYATSETEPLVPSSTPRSLVDAVDEIGELATSRFLGTSVAVAVEPSLRIPVQWYLRNYTAVQYTTEPPQGTQAMVWRTEHLPEINLQEYYARPVAVATSWSGTGGRLGELWRWLMYREPFGETKTVQMMLYLHK